MSICMKCSGNFSEITQLRKCNHRVCNQCLCDHLASFTSAKIRCPVDGCLQFIADSVIRMCLSDAQLKFYDVLCLAPNTVKCLIKKCPYFISFDDLGGQFVCPICKQSNCLSCGRLHDADLHCGSIKDYRPDTFESYAANTLKERERLELTEFFKTHKLIPNPSSFECSICFEFFLPRKGVILRNCMHTFCKDCLKGSITSIKYIGQMTCLNTECKKPLDSSELTELLNEQKLAEMMIKETLHRFFQCKAAGCNGFWEVNGRTQSHTCSVCHKKNCVSCKDIHEGISCQQFRNTNQYISALNNVKVLPNNRRINCFICTKELIQDGGCGSLHCSLCGNNTCIFTGKIAGVHEPRKCGCNELSVCRKISMYCNCTIANKCSIYCDRLCIAE